MKALVSSCALRRWIWAAFSGVVRGRRDWQEAADFYCRCKCLISNGLLFDEIKILRKFGRFGLQKGLFCVAIRPLSRCDLGSLGLRKRLFCKIERFSRFSKKGFQEAESGQIGPKCGFRGTAEGLCYPPCSPILGYFSRWFAVFRGQNRREEINK